MRYKTGDEVYDISRDRIGVILSVGEDTYELALDGYDLPLFASENSLILLDDIGRLQAENERLTIALQQVATTLGLDSEHPTFDILAAIIKLQDSAAKWANQLLEELTL